MKLFTTCRFIFTISMILCTSWVSPIAQAQNTTSQAPIWSSNPWFFITALILIVIVIFASVRISTRQLRTQNHQLKEQLNHHAQSIQTLVSQKERMFANIASEFRTPLTLTLEPMGELLDIENNQRVAQGQSLKSTNTTDKPSLKSQLQSLFRFNQAKIHTRTRGQQHYSLSHTLNYIVACFDTTFNAKSLVVSIGSFEEVYLSLEPDSLEIILTSLIANAVKYTNKGGSINIIVEQDSKNVTITITDNGIGIEPEHQQLIFNHLGNDEKPSMPAGTGVGLALVKELVSANLGSINLTSALNKGSSFIVTLPKATQKPKTIIDKAQPSNIATLLTALEIRTLNSTQIAPYQNHNQSNTHDGKSQVLVIDDNQELLNLIKEILTPHFDCQLAPNGEQGLHMAQENLPDLVLCDVMMPGISGFEVLSELKSSPLTAHIPVILLTAKGDAESRIEGWKNRADEYLSKPFNNQELVARITNLLAIRKSISNRYQQQFAQAMPINGSPTQSANNQDGNSPVGDELDLVAQDFSQQLEAILAERYQDEDLTVATIATELALSQRQLIRKTKSLLGMTPNETLRAFRLKKAAEFLREGKTPSTITFDVGFSSHSYFGTCFKNQFGCTPSEYRKQHLNNNN